MATVCNWANFLYSVPMESPVEQNTPQKTEAPHLTMRPQFEDVLSDYHPSAHALQVIRDVKLVVMTGPSGAGRNTLIFKILETGKYHSVITDTTRPKRYNDGVLEVDGRDYWFRNEADMLEDLRRGEFLEAEIIHNQQVSGVSVRELEQASQKGKIAITHVDIGGINNILKAKKDTIAIMVFAPDFASWQQRFSKRGKMDPTEVRRRLETSLRIFEQAEEDDRFQIVINDTVENAIAQIRRIAEEGAVDPVFQAKAKQIVRQLRHDTEEYLKTLET